MIYSVNLQRKINDMDLEFLCFNTLNMRFGINCMVIHCRILFITSRSYEYTNINAYIRNIIFYRHTVQYVFDYRLRDLLFGNKAATCLTK